jgi:RNA polymerase sigma-70 factor (ECF subfamily)
VFESMIRAERVAFILHDLFGGRFTEVAEITGRRPAACRQLASTARRRVRASRADAASPARRASLVRNFERPGKPGTSAPSSASSTPKPP